MRNAGTALIATAARVLCLGLLTACNAILPAAAAGRGLDTQDAKPFAAANSPIGAPVVAKRVTTPYVAKHANFLLEQPSPEARHIADWVVDSGDNRKLPFAIVDKKQARVFVFDARGELTGAAAALLGLAVGDDSTPGIGDRPMARISPQERTTPAGRFVAALDHNASGKDILWVDYDNAISMHAVITGTVADRRTQRLATPSVLDNRISFGCINVPVMFFEQVVRPAFSRSDGIVYVLPETRPASKMFASYDVDAHALAQNAAEPAQEKINAVALRNPAPAR